MNGRRFVKIAKVRSANSFPGDSGKIERNKGRFPNRTEKRNCSYVEEKAAPLLRLDDLST